MDIWKQFAVWAREQQYWLIPLGVGSVLLFIGTLIAVPFVLLRLPEDYFLNIHSTAEDHVEQKTLPWGLLKIVLKNVLGAVFLLMGIAMLLLPGQGLLTILLGLMLIEFPGKTKIAKWLLNRNSTQNTLNWIRRQGNKPPFQFHSHNLLASTQLTSSPPSTCETSSPGED